MLKWVFGVAPLFFLLLCQGAVAAGGDPMGTIQSQIDCPALSTFLKRLGEEVKDLGGSELFDDDESPVEPLGSEECPRTAATRCEKLKYVQFMFALMDMSPRTYRRRGIAAFLANAFAEDSSFGDSCSAERIAYKGETIRAQFSTSLLRYFCDTDAKSRRTAVKAGIIQADGSCDTTNDGLTSLKHAIMFENPSELTSKPEYSSSLGPVVVRIYRDKFSLLTDYEAFRYRGRGFLQITSKANYAACQSEIEKARAYLSQEPKLATTVERVTKVPWRSLDIVQAPEAVSANRYVAAFCAAAFWNRNSAQPELTWTDEAATFQAIVRTINTGARKPKERFPIFQAWCRTLECRNNYPADLNLAAGFQAIASGARTGLSR